VHYYEKFVDLVEYNIPNQAHYASCPALELLCNRLYALRRKFRDPCSTAAVLNPFSPWTFKKDNIRWTTLLCRHLMTSHNCIPHKLVNVLSKVYKILWTTRNSRWSTWWHKQAETGPQTTHDTLKRVQKPSTNKSELNLQQYNEIDQSPKCIW